MSNEHEAEHIRRIYAAQANQEAREPRATPAIDILRGAPGPAAANDNLNQRIIRTYERIRATVDSPDTDTRIYAKIARAIEERRVPEGEIAQILACIGLARNRGAYFVAAAKKAFTRNGLSWHTEEWT